jgi:hypothetical protein
MDLADLDRRSQEQTSKKEAGWEWLRSRVLTGIHSQLYIPPLCGPSFAKPLGLSCFVGCGCNVA